MTLSPRRIFFWHCVVIVVLALGHLAGMPTLARPESVAEKFFHQYLDLNSEGTPASYFSALALLATALTACLVARGAATAPERRFWLMTALLLAFFSFDEAASIHEGFVVIGKAFLPQHGIFYFTWWVPYVLALTPVLAILAPGLLRIPAEVRNGLMLAGALFVTGALGLELVESRLADAAAAATAHTSQLLRLRYGFALLTLAEECLEMTAVAIALRTLLRHAARTAPDISLRIAIDPRRAGKARSPRLEHPGAAS